MAPLNTLSLDGLPSLRRQRLVAEFAALRQACPEGVFVTLTPGDPTLWSAVLFVRHGPYAQAVLRFRIAFPDAFPALPPLVTFSTDMLHPLISPLTTYMYTVSARDDQRLCPGGFSLRHGFPGWFGAGQAGGGPSAAASPAGRDVSIYHVLAYIRSAFDSDHVLDAVPLEAAGNPGAWHAWRTHRRGTGGAASARRSGEWNWEGVWEDRVKKGIAASLSDAVLFGGGGLDELIRFLAMEDHDAASVKETIHGLLDNAA